jgi:hypothetical protein
MTKFTRAALATALLSLAAAPVAAAAAVTPPPTDPVRVTFGTGCPPPHDDPCDLVITGPDVSYDRTYGARLVAWAEGLPGR